jgi:hypothetical protein
MSSDANGDCPRSNQHSSQHHNQSYFKQFTWASVTEAHEVASCENLLSVRIFRLLIIVTPYVARESESASFARGVVNIGRLPNSHSDKPSHAVYDGTVNNFLSTNTIGESIAGLHKKNSAAQPRPIVHRLPCCL